MNEYFKVTACFILRWLGGPKKKWYDTGNTRCGESLPSCPAIDAKIVYDYKGKNCKFLIGKVLRENSMNLFAYLSEFKRPFKLLANFCHQSVHKAWRATLIHFQRELCLEVIGMDQTLPRIDISN